MLNDIHLRELHDWLTPEDIFPNTNIREGVCYFLMDKGYENSQVLTRVVTHENNKIIEDIFSPMKIEGVDIFIRDGKAFPILTKVLPDENTELIFDYISVRKPFGIESNIIKTDKFRPTTSELSNLIICYGKSKAIGYMERDEVEVRSQWVDLWKVFTPRANNIGTELSDDNLNAFVGEPNTICTEAYMVIGVELGLDKISANNLSTYMTIKFTRYLRSLSKGSHDAVAKNYRFIPLQDFTEGSDIDWSVLVKEVDKQLYKKYRL